ncbi:MAG: glutamate-1-semialdehyde 2,1-aminomutase [Bacteroidia bacterium]|nr:glutamate-1-semialdehyde 2,1-aminomutase [Bacteroidia bacterium]MDW8302325.1 glutamate-1-semialdehyde 2,1-aminomutase [Bacteroidia bacterium]
MQISHSQELFQEAKKYIPGGVNSPVRAFKSVGGNPVFIKYAKGAYLFDEDGNSYIDLINSWGPMILGHAYPPIVEAVQQASTNSFSYGAPTRIEVEMAKLICELVPSIEKVRMVNSGTEATMSAIRAARGYTNRDKIIKFAGCYHGHGDSFLVDAGSGALTFGVPNSAGVTKGTAKDTISLPFNDLNAVKQAVAQNKGEIAAIILEPIVGNMGCVPAKKEFLQGLRELCTQEGIVLIFDEVMTGFRISLGGAQEYYGVQPDMTTLGKIIGGGLPVGAYGGKAEIMDCVAPVGKVYQAGTLSGNPIAMTAGYTTLRILADNPDLLNQLNKKAIAIGEGIKNNLKKLGLNYQFNQVNSMFTLFFTETPVTDLSTALTSDTQRFAQYFHYNLRNGIYLAPSQFEAMFVSCAISDEDIEKIIKVSYDALVHIHELKNVH